MLVGIVLFVFLTAFVGKRSFEAGVEAGLGVGYEAGYTDAKREGLRKAPPAPAATISNTDPAEFGLGWGGERIKVNL
jgi:hypothetical protein